MAEPKLIDLLKRVGVGNGVRVFVASRKQYLPDFLVSYRAARECRLEFNVLQVISDDNERTACNRFVHDVTRDFDELLISRLPLRLGERGEPLV